MVCGENIYRKPMTGFFVEIAGGDGGLNEIKIKNRTVENLLSVQTMIR